ncbi:hypothetical protein NPX13_g8230 [Xylaria arbuscula]|uniref:Uncharacterized protein n=1 Tax=Xylaria arbuscula TaxID=114810 RepID=A0A9W8N8J9_9PEZI|nr:hypothetical protein NPX13_g8230 [Xylaria arbuscula]
MMNYREIKWHFDLKVVPQCAKICYTMKMMSEVEAYKELKRVRTVVAHEVLIPLESLVDGEIVPHEKHLTLRRSIDELITYLSDKISSLDPDNASAEQLECGINPAELKRAKATWAWLETLPGGWCYELTVPTVAGEA